MRTVRIAIVSLLLLLGVTPSVFAAMPVPLQSPLHSPKIALPVVEIDLGEVNQASTASGKFSIINAGDAPLQINEIRPSCGCTVVKFKPGTTIAPGQQLELEFTIDTTGKAGEIRKGITIKSNDPEKPEAEIFAYMRVLLPVHQQIDRKAIFKGKCGECHAKPAKGLEGEALFEAVCAMCHGHYGLGGLARRINDYAYLTNFNDKQFSSAISAGVAESAMPSFAKEHGGPLNDRQIQSLVKYMRWWEQGFIFKANEKRREQ